MAGLYKLRAGQLAFELGIPTDQEQAVWDELRRVDLVFREEGVVLIRSRVKHLRTRGRNMAVSIAKDVALIAPDHPLRRRFLELYGETPWLAEHLTRLEGFSGAFGGPCTPHHQADSENPSEGSDGVPGLGHGLGHGNGQVGEDSERDAALEGSSGA
jgi:hypothetical protein